MSFIEQVATINECGTIVNGINGCTYDTFMTEMLNIEKSINEAVNTFNRLINTDAISSLLEDGGELSTVHHKDTLLLKLKAAWNNIVDLFFQMLDTIWNWIYEQLVLQVNYIDKHKEDIMKTTVIYGKHNAEIVDTDGKTINKYTTYINEPYINTYSKILNPNFIEPFMDINELNKYMNDNGRVDTKKIYEYYKDTILGDLNNIDIDDINDKKADLIKDIKSRFSDVKSRKKEVISIRKKYQIPPKELTPSAVKEFQSISMAQIESLKAYNRVTLDYCKAATSILKKFIKNSKKEDEK
jgi:hypothetical protein